MSIIAYINDNTKHVNQNPQKWGAGGESTPLWKKVHKKAAFFHDGFPYLEVVMVILAETLRLVGETVKSRLAGWQAGFDAFVQSLSLMLIREAIIKKSSFFMDFFP